MGVIILRSTLDGGFTPICNICGITLEYDISEEDYNIRKEFWDEWKCPNCKPKRYQY